MLNYLDQHQLDIISALKDNDRKTLTHHETRLKLTLAKPSIDYMLDHF